MKRTVFLRMASTLLGTPYIYGGRSDLGVDCWGLVALAAELAGGPKDWRTWWTDKAWAELEPVETFEAMISGDLIFYGGDPADSDDVSHVAILLNNLGMTYEASGGDHTTLTPTEARRRGAQVRSHDSYLRRKDFRGFRRLPAEFTKP